MAVLAVTTPRPRRAAKRQGLLPPPDFAHVVTSRRSHNRFCPQVRPEEEGSGGLAWSSFTCFEFVQHPRDERVRAVPHHLERPVEVAAISSELSPKMRCRETSCSSRVSSIAMNPVHRAVKMCRYRRCWPSLRMSYAKHLRNHLW